LLSYERVLPHNTTTVPQPAGRHAARGRRRC